jgi:hypothetical protein
MMDIYGLIWGSTGLKYIYPPFTSISPLGNRKIIPSRNTKLRDIIF